MSAGRVVVVGGGLAGLSAAAVLAARGHLVTVLERAPGIGGQARAVLAAGARVDVGPTLLTDAAPLHALFEAAGAPRDTAPPLVRLDPGFVATFAGGRTLAMHADAARLAGAVGALGRHASADWERVLDLGARAARLAVDYYARGDVGRPADVVRLLAGGGFRPRDLAPFVRHASLAGLLESEVRTPELRTVLGHGARFAGLDAARAPAVLLVIPYLLLTAGVWYVAGGVSALAEQVCRLATKAGAAVETAQTVGGLEVDRRRVRAVVTGSGRRVPADAVVSAADLAECARWLPASGLARQAGRLAPALAARVAWWVVEGVPRLAPHHAFHFGLVGPGDEGREPLYVALPTVTDPGLASPDVSVVYALVHGAPGAPARPDFADALRSRVAAAGQWPAGAVLASGVAGGAASCYGYEIRPGLLGALRPAQRVRDVANLVLAGGSVFPGPGVANVIRSGLRAAALVEEVLGG